MSKGFGDSLMPIVLLAGIGLVAFYLFKDNPLLKGATITLQNIGATGGGLAHRWSEFDIKSRKKEAEVGAGIMDFFGDIGYNLQQIPSTLNDIRDKEHAKNVAESDPLRELIYGENDIPRDFIAKELAGAQNIFNRKKTNPPSIPKLTNNCRDMRGVRVCT